MRNFTCRSMKRELHSGIIQLSQCLNIYLGGDDDIKISSELGSQNCPNHPVPFKMTWELWTFAQMVIPQVGFPFYI